MCKLGRRGTAESHVAREGGHDRPFSLCDSGEFSITGVPWSSSLLSSSLSTSLMALPWAPPASLHLLGSSSSDASANVPEPMSPNAAAAAALPQFAASAPRAQRFASSSVARPSGRPCPRPRRRCRQGRSHCCDRRHNRRRCLQAPPRRRRACRILRSLGLPGVLLWPVRGATSWGGHLRSDRPDHLWS